MADLVIRNGRVVTPSGTIFGGVAVEGERIVHVGSNSSLPQARRVLDAQEQYVIPGLIDAHVHMESEEDPSLEEGLQANLPVETEGAVHGGVTTIGQFAGWKGQSLVERVRRTVAVENRHSRVDYFFHAFIMGEDHLKEQPELCRMGVTSFKHFFDAYKPRKGMELLEWLGPVDSGVLYQSFRFIGRHGYPAVGMVHAEDIEIVDVLERELRAGGRQDLLAWTEARPNFVEFLRIAMAFEIARATGATLYIAHMSTAEGADFVAARRREGYPIWAETGPCWLTHTGDMEAQIGCWGKVNPSLKYKKDTERLWRGIRDGGVTCLGTDHGTGGRTLRTRERGGGKHNNIWNARPGIRGGLEHLLPVMMTFGVNAGRITMEELVQVGSTNTAKVFGLYPRKGVLAPGADADIVIVDPDREATVDQGFYHCLCECSIYQGYTFKGMARTTVLRGKVVMEDYQTTGKPGDGTYIPRPATGGGRS